MAISLLLADDSPTIAKILSLALQSEQYEIRAVLTAEEALDSLKANPPFFFLCDLSLPAKNGYEFARLIKSDAKLSKIRVVLLASAFEPVDEQMFQACGADGLVKKPFDPSELRAALRRVHDLPPKSQDHSKVTGSLSGFTVTSPDPTPVGLSLGSDTPPPAPRAPPSEQGVSLGAGTEPEVTDLSSLLTGNAGSADADSILAGLLGGGEQPSLPSNPTSATVLLDLSGNEMEPVKHEAPRGVAASFTTPPGGTALIDMSLLGAETAPSSPAEEPLSANAQALAAFFAAEIQSQAPAAPTAPPASPPKSSVTPQKVSSAPAAPPVREDDFESSLGSIDWDTPAPAKESLNAWSANQPKESPPAKPPAKPAAASAPGPQASATSVDMDGMMFDTGHSTFRFSDDYVQRITKSFTGADHEEIPQKHTPIFTNKSDDAAPSPSKAGPATGFGGGAWTDADMEKIEQIVREEVQMVVREVAEKIAWEVIPELAENIIRKELDKVLKEMEPG